MINFAVGFDIVCVTIINSSLIITKDMNTIEQLNRAADNIRILAASMVEKAKSGHPGGAMGGADFANVLLCYV